MLSADSLILSPFGSGGGSSGGGGGGGGGLPVFPDGTSTGYENTPGYPGSLTDGSAITITSNTSYQFYANLGGGSIGTSGTPVSNVTFTGCCWANSGISAICALLFGTNLTFINCTFQPAPLASWPPSSKN